MTMNFIYELPFFKHRTGFLNAALGGWEWSGIATFQSGFPFTVTISGDRAGVGGGTQRPNVIGTPSILGTVNEYFNMRFPRLPLWARSGTKAPMSSAGRGFPTIGP